MNKTHSALLVLLLLIISSCILYQTIIIHNNNDREQIVFKDYIEDKRIDIDLDDQQKSNYSKVTQATHMGSDLNNPKPLYPLESLKNKEQGVVRLIVMIEPDGSPSDVQIAKSSGYKRLDYVALKTVKESYRFKPATRNNIPIRAAYTFNIVFKLDR